MTVLSYYSITLFSVTSKTSRKLQTDIQLTSHTVFSIPTAVLTCLNNIKRKCNNYKRHYF